MSLGRAFTTKRSRQPYISAPMPQRSGTTKHYAAGTIRNKISAPVELISTTNMLSYNAPDLYPGSSSSSSQSGDEYDLMPALTSSSATSPDSSSVGSSPASPLPNHLSSYFVGPTTRQSSSSSEDVPQIPQRSSSRKRRTHEMIQRVHSQTRMSSGQTSASIKARDSIQMFSSNTHISSGPEPHPFGNELAQVTELAEEYGNIHIIDQEEQELIAKGLFKFNAEDYRDEIDELFAAAFEIPVPMRTMWI